MAQDLNDSRSNDNPYWSFDCTDLAPMEAYRLLTHMVAPRPIALVSTLSPEGLPNLAPFSFFMAGGSNPPSIAFSPNTNQHGQPKDTLRNIQATKEFTINLVSQGMQEQVNMTSLGLEYGISEWEQAGFTAAPTRRVSPARVAESLMAMECQLYQIVPHGKGVNAANYVIGEVVAFHVAKSLIINGEIDATQVQYISRMGGNWYSQVTAQSMFELTRPPLEHHS